MTRRTWSAVLALSLAGGVYLAGTSAQASNMGFKLERDFPFARTSGPSGLPLKNTYWVSLAYFNGLGDVADSVSLCGGAPCNNKCVGEVDAPPGPAGDGVIDARDAMCDWWTERANPTRAGAFAMCYFDAANCAIVCATANITLNKPRFGAGNFPPSGDLKTDIGYQINIGDGAAGSPNNRAVIVGSHDPAFAGHVINYSTTCGATASRSDLIAMPYHSMYQKSIENFCGLRGVDWQDADNNWLPDITTPAGCPGGLFDGSHTLAINTVKSSDPNLGGTSGFVSQSASFSPLTGVRFTPATSFDLIPGEAYLFNVSAGQLPRTYRSPHF